VPITQHLNHLRNVNLADAQMMDIERCIALAAQMASVQATCRLLSTWTTCAFTTWLMHRL
jgi:hypothetical protein